MHPLPRQTLRQLLADFGPTLLNDPVRVDALLADLWGSYHSERFLLFHAAKLFSQSQHDAVHRQRFSQRLQRRYGFSADAAHWAVESWCAALDIAPLNPNAPRAGNDIRDSRRTEFSDSLLRVLRRLFADRGPALLNDPARVDALLADLCEPYSRERFLLFHALRERIPVELLIQTQDDKDHEQRLSQRLQSRYGFSAEAAKWTVESWSLALKAARSGQDPTLAEEQAVTVRIVRQKEREQNLAVEVVRQKVKERDAAQETTRLKEKEKIAAEEIARQKTEAEATARQKVEAEAVALQKAEEVKEIILQILEYDPLTSPEMAEILRIGQEQAVAWLNQLQKAGKIEEIYLKRSKHYPVGYRIRNRSYTTANATNKARKAAGVAARQKVGEWREVKTKAHQTVVERTVAEAAVRQKERERITAEAVARTRVQQWKEAVATTRQKERERITAEAVARTRVQQWKEAIATAQKIEKEQATAEAAARSKRKNWSVAEAAARQLVEERKKAEAEARLKAKKSQQIILQNLKQYPLTSREVSTILQIEQEQAIALLKRLLKEDRIEFTWSKRSPYTPCYQIRKRPNARPSSSPATSTKKQSSSRRSGCLWLLALLGPLGLLALLAQSCSVAP